MRFFVALILALALGVMGCSETAATGGTGGGGTAGDGGVGGNGGGSGGDPIVECLSTTDRCSSGTLGPYEACCDQTVPEQPNACDGTESIVNPATCAPTGNTVTHRLTLLELEDDCDVGYDLDDCEGLSCVPTGLAPAEGMSGVDNALAGSEPSFADIGADLRYFNQGLSDALCGVTDDCLLEIVPTEIRFVVDANASENCANVTVQANGESSAHILNLSDDGCASGTLGTIPITIHGNDVSLENTVVRMTVSSEGFSHGMLGAVMDLKRADLLSVLFGGRVVAAVAVYVFDISVSTPPTRDASADCNGLSVTLRIGGAAE